MSENKKIQPGDVYKIAAATLPAEDIEHHASDLYLKRSAAATAIVARLENKVLLTTFRDANGVVWYELPFCFAPYWESKDKSKFY